MQEWLSLDNKATYPNEVATEPIKVANNLEKLETYTGGADEKFWENFPKRNFPKTATTRINVNALKKEIKKVQCKMSVTEQKRAEKVVKSLREGAESYQKIPPLPPAIVPNAKSSTDNGYLLTDKICTWTEGEFVAGPFPYPPMEGFRANPLATICRNGKIRPVLNMSGPRGKSFNDNIDMRKVEKVHMATAKEFSYGLKEAGKNASFSKFDICDAYKLVPSKPEDFRLQGFKWLEKYFCETQQTFGSRASVSNFDRLGNTICLMVCLNSETPRTSTYRVLDDTPCIAREGSESCKKFSEEMRRLCKAIDLPLAKNCDKNDKAFENQSNGTVLGIKFDSTKMEWSLPGQKADKIVRRCMDAQSAMHLDLNQVQKLMGSVNDLAQMCPIIKHHKGTGNAMLEKYKGNENILMQTSTEFKEDMRTIAMIADRARMGMPIADRPNKPSLSCLTFYTDAAGASFTMVNKERVFKDQADRGVACLGGTEVADIWLAGKLTWPEGLLTETKDEKGVSFGSKTTTLESVGLLIPFLLSPELIEGRHILFKVDNIAVHYGWENGCVKNDKSATEVLKCVAYLAGYMGCTVYVEHVPRNSEELAELADELSRKREAKCENVNKVLKKAGYREVESIVKSWLRNPVSGGELTRLLVQEIMEKL